MRKVGYKRQYFTRFSLEQHTELITIDQLVEIQEKFYLTTRELAYLFGIRTGTMKRIMDKKIEIPFTVQLNLYYLLQDPAMIYKVIKEKKKFDKAKEKELDRLQQQGVQQ